jgi:MFS family permease
MPTSPTTRTRLAAVLFITQSFFSASTIAAFTLSPIIATTLSGSELYTGVPNTLTLVGRALFAYPMGYMMDRLGRRLALGAGYGLSVIGGFISIVAIINNSFLLFLVGAFAFGMARASGEQSRYVAAEIYPLRERARMIGLIVFAGTIGAIGGPLLVAPSTEWAVQMGQPADAGPFWISIVFMVIGTLITLLFLRPDPREIGLAMAEEEAARDVNSVENSTANRPMREIFANPTVILAMIAMVVSYFVMAFLMVITPLHMSHHAHTTSAISNVIMAHTLGMFGFSWLTGWLIDKWGRLNMILVSGVILLASCIIAPLSLHVPILGLALFLLGLGWNFGFVAGSSLLSDALAARERGRAQGISEAIVGITAGGASLSVGLVFQQGDYILVSIIGFVLTLTMMFATVWLGRTADAGKVKKTAVASD